MQVGPGVSIRCKLVIIDEMRREILPKYTLKDNVEEQGTKICLDPEPYRV